MRSTKIKNVAVLVYLHHMVILRSQNKIIDFFMILAWDCPFNIPLYILKYIHIKFDMFYT